MKKLLIAGNVVLLSIVLLQVASQTKRSEDAQKSIVQQPACLRTICRNYTDSPLKGLINADLAKEMADLYANDINRAFIKGDSNRPDALSIVFEIEKLKTLIWKIENAVCKAGCKNSLQLGIRFYYAKYPNNVGTEAAHQDLRELPPSYAEKQTLFMTASFLYDGQFRGQREKIWKDFDFNQIGAGCKLGFPFTPGSPANKPSVFTFTDFSSPDGDNHGGLAPPPTPGRFPVTE